jgi:hypothetical protein
MPNVDVVDVLILALRLLLVALLYLFLLVVLRMAMGGLRPGTGVAHKPAAHKNTADNDWLKLRVVSPGAASLTSGEVVALGSGMTLGRSTRADVTIADTAVSAEHARIDRVGRGWVVTDLGSTNGTRVNDQPVQDRASLSTGDVLSLGTVRLEVLAR